MSNCIDLRDNVVRFTSADIDIDALFALLAKVPDALPQGDTGELTTAWWYLKTCTVLMGDGTVHIAFGQGRSSHTWRDFHGLVNRVINPLMKRRKSHTFKVRDEDARGFGRWTVTFGEYMSYHPSPYNGIYEAHECPACKGTGKVHLDVTTILPSGEKVRGIEEPCAHDKPVMRLKITRIK